METTMTDETTTRAEQLSLDIQADETSAERFKRIANPRLAKCQVTIRALGKCSSKDYSYTPEQVAKIKEILQKELDSCIAQFEGKSTVSAGVL
jgi:predicted transcriptional regulator